MTSTLHDQKSTSEFSQTQQSLPLSSTQLGIWMGEQLIASDNAYTVAHYLELKGDLDVACLSQAIRMGLVEADTVLATYHDSDEGPRQTLRSEDGWQALADIQREDFCSEHDALEQVRAIMYSDVSAPLNADSSDALFCHRLFQIDGDHWIWYQRYHHICVDGYSFHALTRRMVSLYNALLDQVAVPATPYVPYADWVDEQNQYQNSRFYQRDRAFWMDYLQGQPEPESLSCRDLGVANSFANVEVLRHRITLDEGVVARLAVVDQPQRIEPTQMAMAMVCAYLGRMLLGPMSKSGEISIGVPFMRRFGSIAAKVSGPAVNVLPMRLSLEPGMCLTELAQTVSAELKRIRLHQRYDAEQIQRDLGLHGVGGSLYGATVNLKLYDQSINMNGIVDRNHLLAAGPVEDIEFGLWVEQGELIVELTANPDRYTALELQWHCQRLDNLIQLLLKNSDAEIQNVALLSVDELHQIQRWSVGKTVTSDAHQNSVMDVFYRSAQCYRTQTAIIYAEQSVSFATLLHQVSVLGAALQQRGVRSGDVIGVALPRGPESIVAMLAVLSVGAVYLPVDLEYPEQRLAFLCGDAKPAWVLLDSQNMPVLPAAQPVICVDSIDLNDMDAAGRRSPMVALHSQDLAYLIYTSGSTGNPKGVMVSHGALLNLLLSHEDAMFGDVMAQHFPRRVRALHSTSFAFDAAWEQLIWLLLGQELHLCDDEQRRDAHALVQLVQRNKIDALDVSPSLLQQMLDCGLMDANGHPPGFILVGSEPVPGPLWQRVRSYPQLSVMNCYRPTEYTVDTSIACVADAELPVIGQPIANTHLRVLNAELQYVPIGVEGELYVGGKGIAQGYWMRADLTASRFVADPYESGQLLYRTGDIVRWNASGQLEFVGREDHQVKVRGFRIELGEIEQAIALLPDVAAAVVVPVSENGITRLIGYCTLQAETETLDMDSDSVALSESLLRQLSARLPEYMVPAWLMVLPQWPLTLNGKIDRKALPPVERVASASTRDAETDLEHILCEAVAKVLNLENVGADADFFNLGGDSITAMSLGTQLRRVGYQLRPKDIFAQRTPANMAAQIQPLRIASNEPDEIQGSLGKLPILSWYAQHYGHQCRYAQGVLIRVPAALALPQLRSALLAVQRAHPALRARSQGEELVLDSTCSYEIGKHIQEDVAPNQAPQRGQWLESCFRNACHRLSPAQGITLQAILIAEPSGRKDASVMLVAHHLVMDGMSWRVLLSELKEACSSVLEGAAPFIQREDSTLQAWSGCLHGQIESRRQELNYWQQQLAESHALLGDRELCESIDTYGSAQHKRTLLDAELTSAVLAELPQGFGVTTEEVLLSAVAMSLQARFDCSALRFALESHGRQPIDDNIDLSRTIGWLTSEYPMTLKIPQKTDMLTIIKAVKQGLRASADRGLGYGVLRYLDKASSKILADMERRHRPQILFNYLGRFHNSDQLWQPSVGAGPFTDVFAVDNDPVMPMLYPIEINIFVDESQQPQFAINWTWAAGVFSQADIDFLHQHIEMFLSDCLHVRRTQPAIAADTLVPSETLTQSGGAISAGQLDQLSRRYGPLSAVLPVMPLQEGLLFHAQLGEQASKYNSITRLDFKGDVQAQKIRAALDSVLQRHPQLAALFDTDTAAEPLLLLPQDDGHRRWPFTSITLSAELDQQQIDRQLQQIQLAELDRDFSIGEADAGTLLHAVLVHYDDCQYSLFVTAHHLVVDGWSTPILLSDLLSALEHGADTLNPTRTSYPTVVKQLFKRDLARSREIWRSAMQGVQPTLLFDGEVADPAVHEYEVVVPAELERDLIQKCRKRGVTMNTMMQGVWGALLSIMTGRNDVVFGSPVSGRFTPVDGIDELIGLFSNTIPVRVRLDPTQTLLNQLTQVQAQQIQLLENDGIGLAEIQRMTGETNLFDTLLVVENYPDQGDIFSRDYQGARLLDVQNRGYTHYPLTMLVLPGKQLRFLIEYRNVVQGIDLWAQRLMLLLQHLAYDTDTPWSAVALQTPAERALVARVNQTAVTVRDCTLHEAIKNQAEQSPDATALLDDHYQLTYQQVRQQSIYLAQRLGQAGVRRGDIVAVALPRSVKLSLALYGIIETGAAYLPLDTGYPDDRLQYMVEDASPRLIITTSALANRFAAMGELLLFDDIANDSVLSAMPEWLAPSLSSDQAAYLLYTSGSTGRPKGVLVSHRAIVNRLYWMQHQYSLSEDDRVIQKTPCSFDVSVWEFFWPLMVGAGLYMAPPEAHRDPEALCQLIQQQRITTMHFVPSMLAAFVRHLQHSALKLPSLRNVFCSGEALSRELADAYAEWINAPLHNLYGPTEAAVDVTYKAAAERDEHNIALSSVPIGKPVWNTQLRILDHCLRPVPVGVAGELYLTGVQLADGYLGRADLTASRFVADPLSLGGRMYRTGDVARWLSNGDVEYLGRSDDQLKIRGQRIELGEIESVMKALPGVAQAVVQAVSLATKQPSESSVLDNRQLVGYVVASDDAASLNTDSFDPQLLKQQLSQTLPAHMVPVVIMLLDELPLSANGKLNRKALPVPSADNRSNGRAPKPGMESRLASIFARVLELPDIQADDDFFAMGGHSILAMSLAAELRRALQQPVSVGQIMVSPTVEKLAAVLSDSALANDPANAGFGEILHLRSGSHAPLFCIHPASGFAWQYTGLSRYLPSAWPLVGLQSPRPEGAIAASADMDDVVDRHLKNVRSIQPQGPYFLIGYSLGGTIAQGLAARLQGLGEQVAFLGLLDTYPPEGQDWSGPTEQDAKQEVAREQEQFMVATEDAADEFMLREKAQMFEHIVSNYEDSVRLLSQARTRRFNGAATLFCATQTLPQDMDVQATWAPFLQQLSVHRFACNHEDIVSPESLESVGPLLAELLSDLVEADVAG
jgi:amino acid adenylation domain-containing protein/non-ribosomal peptide synthase protein (TIGR01720 family)